MTTFADLEAMRKGAHNAVRICMNIQPADRVAIIADRGSSVIARLLLEESANAGANATIFVLETFQRRPIRALPESLRSSLLRFRPTVTFFTASAERGEITFRIGLRTFLLRDLNVRHAHMVGITPRIMREGMAVDYRRVERVTRAVYERVRVAQRIHVTSPEGTDLTARFDPALRWVPSTGIYHQQGQWGNLPDGETFTCPLEVNGTIVARVIGDYFSERYGYLKEPLRIVIEDSRVREVEGPQPLANEFLTYVRAGENTDRVGEFAIGTNIGLTRLIGNLLQDEKFPGVHIAFGDPYPEETGARWSSAQHVDVIAVETTIDVDGDVIMREGTFDFDVLQLAP